MCVTAHCTLHIFIKGLDTMEQKKIKVAETEPPVTANAVTRIGTGGSPVRIGSAGSAPIDNRIALCASFVREGTKLADVGTDHAYLPIKLALDGYIQSAVACDVRVGPLENAKNNIIRYGVENIVKTRLSDGLDEIAPDEAYDIVMAGMGGELIAEIINRTKWLYDNRYRLILQPMTRAEILRPFLLENGFNIEKEKACISGRKSYSVMQCSYDGQKRSCDVRTQYIGLLAGDSSEEAGRYIASVTAKLKRKINGLQKSGQDKEAEMFSDILREISR